MFIKNYYENIYDFESNENEYIFTRQNIKEYIKITKKLLNRYTLYNDIQIKNEPYFYNNNDINNGRIYIAYNGNSFSEILEIMYQLFNKSNTNRSVTIYHYVCKNNKILSKNDILISLKINISFVIIITTVINNKNIYTLLYDKNMYK
jgi:histidinol-phosphate/aromatic aminotransferase/cobyric acid decarboxylase-like protein